MGVYEAGRIRLVYEEGLCSMKVASKRFRAWTTTKVTQSLTLSRRIEMFFRVLSPSEEEDFRAYARENLPESGKWEIYHPVCRDEWTKLGQAPAQAEIATVKALPGIVLV